MNETMPIETYPPGSRITLVHPDGSRVVNREVDSVYSIMVAARRDYVSDFLQRGWVITETLTGDEEGSWEYTTEQKNRIRAIVGLPALEG